MAQMGRPRRFDRDQAIDQAMHLFWEHGYDSTSLSQLKASMGGGISAPSFYAAFGSKEALFEEVVARYLDTHGRVTDSLFDAGLPAREAVEQVLRRSARMQCERGHPKGCMVALGAGVPNGESLPEPLAAARRRNRAGFLACVERGIAEGELPGSTDAMALATLFESFLLGLSRLARDGVPLEALEAAIGQLMTLWPPASDH